MEGGIPKEKFITIISNDWAQVVKYNDEEYPSRSYYNCKNTGTEPQVCVQARIWTHTDDKQKQLVLTQHRHPGWKTLSLVGNYFPVSLFNGKKEGDTIVLVFGKDNDTSTLTCKIVQKTEEKLEDLLIRVTSSFWGLEYLIEKEVTLTEQMGMITCAHCNYARSIGRTPLQLADFSNVKAVSERK